MTFTLNSCEVPGFHDFEQKKVLRSVKLVTHVPVRSISWVSICACWEKIGCQHVWVFLIRDAQAVVE